MTYFEPFVTGRPALAIRRGERTAAVAGRKMKFRFDGGNRIVK